MPASPRAAGRARRGLAVHRHGPAHRARSASRSRSCLQPTSGPGSSSGRATGAGSSTRAAVIDEFLTRGTDGRLQVILSAIEPGGGTGDEAYTHESDEEVVIVLEGVLDLWVGPETSASKPATRSPIPRACPTGTPTRVPGSRGSCSASRRRPSSPAVARWSRRADRIARDVRGGDGRRWWYAPVCLPRPETPKPFLPCSAIGRCCSGPSTGSSGTPSWASTRMTSRSSPSVGADGRASCPGLRRSRSHSGAIPPPRSPSRPCSSIVTRAR